MCLYICRKTLVVVILSCMLSACTSYSGQVVTVVPSMLPISSSPSPTLPPTTILASPTKILPSYDYEYFPLKVGLTRVYKVLKQQYQVSNTSNELVLSDETSATVSETITNFDNKEGLWLYDVVIKDSVDGKRAARYEVSDEYIYGSTFVEIEIRWPLTLGQEWYEREADSSQELFDKPYWKVLRQTVLETPAGDFTDCYELEHRRVTSSMGVWLCREVGIAKIEFSMPNSGYSEIWELQSIQYKQ